MKLNIQETKKQRELGLGEFVLAMQAPITLSGVDGVSAFGLPQRVVRSLELTVSELRHGIGSFLFSIQIVKINNFLKHSNDI